MTRERQFDMELRAWFEESAPSGQPQGLLESVVSATGHIRPRPRWLVGLRGEPMPETSRPGVNRFAPVALAATALIVAVLIGIRLLIGPPNVGPSPIPGPSRDATPVPTEQRAAAWTVSGSMAEVRTDYTATLLVDGRVLVVGGDRGPDATPRALASAEVYDPATGTWTGTGSLVTGRFSHTATLLADGKVLVAGGTDSGRGRQTSEGEDFRSCVCLASAELYDPASGTWTVTGSMITDRGDHTATLLPDGRVLVAGGKNIDQGVALAELYDPATGSWTATRAMGAAHVDALALLLLDGRVMVLGGGGTAELYQPRSESWSSTDCCPESKPSATLLRDGQVLVAGGDVTFPSAGLYDPARGTLAAIGNMIEAHSGHTATLLPDGRVLLAGGDQGGASAEIYDPATGSWTTTASMTHARFGAWAIGLLDGRVLVFGGSNNTGVLTSAELYGPGSST
jgi:hypothetical protein